MVSFADPSCSFRAKALKNCYFYKEVVQKLKFPNNSIAITSNPAQKGIEISNNDLADGFLPKKSVIKVDKVYTLESGIANKKIGKIDNDILSNVE
jgi:hypothetical protein